MGEDDADVIREFPNIAFAVGRRTKYGVAADLVVALALWAVQNLRHPEAAG